MRLPSILPYIYNKLRNGANEYLFTEDGRFGINGSNIDIAQDHPILTPAILFVSKLFAQAEFNIKNKNTGKNVNNHWFLNLIDKPNFFQTKIDFLECLSFTMIATGVSIVYAKRTIGMQPNSMYILDARLLKYPEGFKTEMLNYNQYKNSNITLKYDEDGENLDIKLKDLLFFYDLPNGLQKNKTKNKSRLDGLHQTLENTKDSLIAKNIILRTNGKVITEKFRLN